MNEELKPCPWCGGKADATLREVRGCLEEALISTGNPEGNCYSEIDQALAKLDKLIGGE